MEKTPTELNIIHPAQNIITSMISRPKKDLTKAKSVERLRSDYEKNSVYNNKKMFPLDYGSALVFFSNN